MRWFLRASALLMAGLILAVGAAWASAAWGRVGVGASTPTPGWQSESDEIPELAWHVTVPSDWQAPTSVSAAHGLAIALQSAAGPKGSATVMRTGWPLYSFRSASIWQPRGGATPWYRTGIELSGTIMLEARFHKAEGVMAPGPGQTPVPN